jgi:ribosomal protein RSM22 (predicted rRNA methylase)
MAARLISPSLPAELKAAIEAKLQGLRRSEIALRAARISQTYRGGGGSAAIRSEADALAYALARMPATYAAVTASLAALSEAAPDFAPKSMLDVGAGPGTASFAATAAFPTLKGFALVDSNPALRTLALDLAQANSRFTDLTYPICDALAAIRKADAADLVIASYVMGEVGETEQGELAKSMWAKSAKALLIVEPGTPAGYARIISLRAQLVAAGAHVVAPCPHDDTCPLSAPDWCHFAQRLPRSRAHKQVKGAELPYEDEKFAFVSLTREAPARRPSRVLRQPVVNKAEVAAKLCTAEGLVLARIPRRDKIGYAQARRWRWGEAVTENA